MTFYFAWTGGEPLPAITVATTGDVWGGQITVLADVWGGELSTIGDLLPGKYWNQKAKSVSNLRDVSGLVAGQTYEMTGASISTSAPVISSRGFLTNSASSTAISINFVFDGLEGGDIDPSAEPAENASLKFVSDFGLDQVRLYDTSQLTVGVTYNVSGAGIQDNTTFEFLGDPIVFISNPAIRTGSNVALTIATDLDQNIIKNIGDTSQLEVGEIYQIFGRGIGSTTLATFQSDGTLLLSENASISTKQTFLRIHRGIVYPDGGDFDESIHAVFDEQVLSLVIDHSEGNFPLLTIDLKNPHIGFLAPGRNVWCWLSWRESNAVPAVPLFHGRLLAIPSNIQNERITLQFLARPSDYENQQSLMMSDLRVPPYYDPVWLSSGVDDATTILEARTAAWHIDRVTLAVTISDITVGEDGTLAVGADQDVGSRHLYDSLNIKYGNPPLAAVYVTGSVSWSQTASGTIDITRNMVRAFQAAGSQTNVPNVSSYAGDGLFNSWPKPLTSIGGGWSVGLDQSIIDYTDIFKPLNLESRFTTAYPLVGVGSGVYVVEAWDAWATLFPLNIYGIHFPVDYEAKRERTENVSFFLEADIQQIATDSRSSVESFSLSSSLIEHAVDPGGQTPIRDSRYNSYFKTERGQDSFRFLLAYARAKLVSRARAVDVSFVVPWKKGLYLTCRQNATVVDPRLAGGSATGKVIAYKLIASASEGMRAAVMIGCTIGKGGVVTATDGEGSYASSGYMHTGYQTVAGGTIDLGDNTIVYENFDDFEVEDDGVNFFTLDADSAVKRITISGGVNQQRDAISMVHSAVEGKAKNPPDPVSALKNCFTVVTLELVPVTGGGFLSEFAVDVSKLQIPKTIDLEAA